MPKAIKALIKKITAWSFSRWTDYEKCPALAKYKHVDKLREPDNAAMENGTIVHRLGEQYVRGDLKKVPKEFAQVESQMRELKDSKAQTEQEWAFNEQYEKVAWFAPTAWLRVKVDAHHLQVEKKGKQNVTTVKIVDYKTGKEKQEHAYQRSLYALGAFLVYPDAHFVVVDHMYVDSGSKASSSFKASELAQIKKQWEQRTRAMLADTRFAPRPGYYCQWCHFSKAKNGPCQY